MFGYFGCFMYYVLTVASSNFILLLFQCLIVYFILMYFMYYVLTVTYSNFMLLLLQCLNCSFFNVLFCLISMFIIVTQFVHEKPIKYLNQPVLVYLITRTESPKPLKW